MCLCPNKLEMFEYQLAAALLARTLSRGVSHGVYESVEISPIAGPVSDGLKTKVFAG